MKIKVTKESTVATIQLMGQFWEKADLLLMTEETTRLINDGVRHIVLDCSRLTFINSTGLGNMATLFSKLQKMEGQLILYKPVGGVRETLELSGFDTLMKLFDSREELDMELLRYRDFAKNT